MSKKKQVIEAINNLRDYITNDTFYNGETKIESDFDKFCYNHCGDIAKVLNALPKKYRE